MKKIIDFFTHKKPTVEELSKRVYIEFIVFTEGLSSSEKIDVLKHIEEFVHEDLSNEERSLKTEICLIENKIRDIELARKNIKNRT